MPPLIVRHDMNMGVGDIGADDFDKRALAEDGIVMGAEFFGGGPDGGVVVLWQIVDFVAFNLGHD